MKRRRLDTYDDRLPAERREAAQAAMRDLRENAIASLATEDGWRAFLEQRIRHGRYSWRNCALIAWQRPDAVSLATFNQWRAAGYNVRRGEHSNVTITGRTPAGFRSVRLFDITQTDCPLETDPGENTGAELERLLELYPAPAAERAAEAAEGVTVDA